jgi:RNA polymerase sigma-70 factor, ECF subfamily
MGRGERPGGMYFNPDGGLVTILALDVADGFVRGLRSIVNPDKLRHLGPVGDRQRLLRS